MWILYLDSSRGMPLLQYAEIIKETKKQFKVTNSTSYSSLVNKVIPHTIVTKEQAITAYETSRVLKKGHTVAINLLKESYKTKIEEVLQNASIRL